MIGAGKILRVKCSPGLNYHFKVLSHNPDSQGPLACQPYGGAGGAPDFCQAQRMPGGRQSNGSIARALRMQMRAGCAGNTPINQMINQVLCIYGNKKHVPSNKCVILGLNDTCFHRTVERRLETAGRRGVIGLLYGMFSM